MAGSPVTRFYERSPNNATEILRFLAEAGRPAAGLGPDDLGDLDHDHQGGAAAVGALARWTGIHAGSRVLDVGAGLGGPARYLAHQYGCEVTAAELTPSRCVEARLLTRLVALDDRVRVVRADAAALPFANRTFDVCISQETLLHVADKLAVLRECHRILVPGGVVACSDWIARSRLSRRDRSELRGRLAAATIDTVAEYRARFLEAGFTGVEVQDLSKEWRALTDRSEDGAANEPDEDGYADYDRHIEHFERLVRVGRLGGARFRAIRP